MIRLFVSCITILIFFVPLCTLFYASIVLGFGFIKVKGIRIVYWIGRLTAESFLFFSGVSVQIEFVPGMTLKKLGESKNILVCNHESSYDTFALQSRFPQPIQFILKKQILMIPFFGWGMYLLGCIPIDRSNRKTSLERLQQLVHKLQKGSYTVIFPEGSRTESGKMQSFKSGVIRMCQEDDDVAVIPIGITGSYEILSKNSWTLRPGLITMRIGTPIFKRDLPEDPYEGTKTLQRMVEKLCEESKKKGFKKILNFC